MTIFSILSNVLYLISVSPIVSAVVIFTTAMLVSLAFRRFGKLRLADVVLLTGISGGLWAAFLGQMTNVAFLNGFGIRAEAVITERISNRRRFGQGAGRSNRFPFITKFGVEVQDGNRSFSAGFSTYLPPIWPMSGGTPLPQVGDTMTVKYIPGAEHNIVVLPYESAYLFQLWQMRLSRLKGTYDASPDALNELSYRSTLIEFLEKFRATAEPELISRYEADLRRLEAGQ